MFAGTLAWCVATVILTILCLVESTRGAWSKEVVKRQEDTTSKAIVRTWVQSYNVQGWVDPNGIEYNAEEVKAQITALFENGLTGGYITWHSGSNIEKYKKQKSAFQIDYLKE